MRLLCLEFPTLPVVLVRRARPHLAERPIVMLDGTGSDATVTAVSPAVASRGVAPGMRASDARHRCDSAMFLPGNTGACIDELERIVAIIRKFATLSVAIASQTRLMIDVTTCPNEQRTAEQLLTLARQWTRMEVRAGIGSSREHAANAASRSRRGVAIDTRGAFDEPSLLDPAPLTGRITLDPEHEVNRRRLLGLTSRLERLQEGFGQACREVRLRATSDGMTVTRTLRFDRPVRATEALERISTAVDALPAGGPTTLDVELARPVPISLASPIAPELAAAV